MKKVWLVVVLAVTVIAFGCGAGGGGGVEATAKKLLDATKSGDVDAWLDHIDLKGMYEAQVPAGAREQVKYEDFVKTTRDAMKRGLKPNPEFEYQIISSEEKGDTATVKVKTKESKDAKWEEADVPFKKIDGKWKLTWEGMMAMGEGH
jgi:hypothetical protein